MTLETQSRIWTAVAIISYVIAQIFLVILGVSLGYSIRELLL